MPLSALASGLVVLDSSTCLTPHVMIKELVIQSYRRVSQNRSGMAHAMWQVTRVLSSQITMQVRPMQVAHGVHECYVVRAM